MAISIASNFTVGVAKPIDSRQTVQTAAELAKLLAYEGLECWVVGTQTKYRYVSGEWTAVSEGGGGGSTGGVTVTQGDGYVTLTDSEGGTAKLYDGSQGETGPQGIQGIQGEKGDKGEKGDTGAQGIQGEKGEKGDKGDTGAQGPQGETGATGAQGAKGDTGAQGIQGEKGDTGDAAHITLTTSTDDDGYTHAYVKTWEGSDESGATTSPDLMAQVNDVLAAVKEIMASYTGDTATTTSEEA